MMIVRLLASALVAAPLVFASGIATAAETVQVTPLGSRDGEFCRLDRAMVFEDPDGTRILYDAGRTVAGADDPRLGDIDVVLVSHVHGDHIGDKHIAAVNDATCAKPQFPVAATPNSNSVNIAVAKDAQILTGSEMPRFFAAAMKRAGGDPKKSVLVRFGASRTVGGVKITTVPAAHSNGLNPSFIDNPIAKALQESGLTGYLGPPTGYVLTFSNGLVVYLSGDTGVTAEQDIVIRRHYKAELAVINIGDIFTTGPIEAAYVINALVKPKSVIASHANEAATEDGKVRPNTRTATFIEYTNVPVHVPLSGRTMSFDADGTCVVGC